MSQVELAERTGRPTKTISEIIKGKAAITPETALQLEKVLGTPASFWMNRERHYRESLARLEEQARLRNDVEWLKTVPIKAMCDLGWIRRFQDKVEQLDEVLRYFGVATPGAWEDIWRGEHVAFRRSKAFECNPGAVAAWLRRGEIVAQSIECLTYDKKAFKAALKNARSLTVEPVKYFTTKLVQMFAEAGVAVAFVPELPGTRVCGATRWPTQHKAIIQLSLRYKTNDHLWFTFFHEAGHILLHGKSRLFIESNDDHGDTEVEADLFAADLLIPKSRYEPFAVGSVLSELRVRQFAKEVGVAPGIVVGRLQHDGKLPRTHLNGLKQRCEWT